MPAKQWITDRSTVWRHPKASFRMDILTVESEGADTIAWASFERGDAVAALIVNVDTEQAMLVRQFRPPVETFEGPEHKLFELAAGVIRQTERPIDSLKREVEEETGYRLQFDPGTGGLKNTELICKYYASPGGSSERIYLYYVAVNGNDVRVKAGGDRETGEFIETEWVKLSTLWKNIDDGVYKDAKIIIAGQWLEKQWQNKRFKSPGDKQDFLYTTRRLVNFRFQRIEKIIGYYARDISQIDDVDVWVNSSNTEFLMDTVYHGTLSGRIRALGSRRAGDRLVEDTIQAELTRKLGMGRGLGIGNVIETGPGALGDSHNVRCILHVASIKATVDTKGKIQQAVSMDDLESCVVRALERCDQLNQRIFSVGRRFIGPYRSILLPLFGAGVDRDPDELKTKEICEKLVPAAVSYVRDHPESLIEKVYFLAYTPNEREHCDSVLSREAGLVRIPQEPVA